MSAYDALSRVYDAFAEASEYEELSKYIIDALERFDVKSVLDAGCGTGTLSLILSEGGFDVSAVDASAEMLSLARAKADLSSADIFFIYQRLEELETGREYDAIVCTRDTLNHMEPKCLKEALRRFSLNLKRGGALIFDINTIYKHRSVLAQNSFVYETEGALLAWRNDYDEASGSVSVFADIFKETKNGLYERLCDDFCEYDIETEQLKELLAENGFEVLETRDGESFEAPRDDSERIIFICRKS